MKVEIWSDIVCPFCYIGKRRFEQAVAQLPGGEKIEVEWKSYQLDPTIENTPGMTVDRYLAERKGISLDHAKEMNAYVSSMAEAAGLTYEFDKMQVANTFDAHRIIHLAKKYNLQEAAEERLFHAYFTEGKNVGDKQTLIALAEEIGLDRNEALRILESGELSEEVRRDIAEAQMVGVTGVPFFVFNHKYAVSGAQSPDVFLRVLEKAAGEMEIIGDGKGSSCSPDGDCD